MRRKGVITTRYCLFCGKEFSPNVSHHTYCSKDCKKKYGMELKRKHPIKICLFCGKEFNTNHNKKYCNSDCLDAFNRKKRGAPEAMPKICKNCGKVFITRLKSKIFCNDKCRRYNSK